MNNFWKTRTVKALSLAAGATLLQISLLDRLFVHLATVPVA